MYRPITLTRVLLLAAYLATLFLPAVAYALTAVDVGTFDLISRMAGATAFSAFCLQYILAGRFKPLERVFGQARLVEAHMAMAAAALLLLWLHVGLTDDHNGGVVQDALGNVAENIFLYLSLAAALFLSDFFFRVWEPLRRWRRKLLSLVPVGYQLNLKLHWFLILGILTAAGHILLLTGFGIRPFKYVITAYAATALAAFVWRALLRPKRLKVHPFTVSHVERHGQATTLTLAPQPGRPFRFQPGQFIYLRLMSPNLPEEEHPFSIASAPAPAQAQDHSFKVTIKPLGDFTRQVHQVHPGDQACVDGPYGHFSYRRAPAGCDLVLIAGGIGITPMLSMLAGLAEEHDTNRNILLLWSVRHDQELVRLADLQRYTKALPKLRVELLFSRAPNPLGRHGRLDKTTLAQILAEHHMQAQANQPGPCFFVCGPPGMADSMNRALTSLGAPASHIFNERFSN